MDKTEYRAKLDQLTAMINAGDYQGAQTIVDEIDWRRVKSARTLCMVSEVYEVNDRLPDSRKVLELAYKRALVKTVAYRLVEVCLKLHDLSAAEDYYEDFADLAPMDNSKYILKYKLYRAKGEPLSSQIKALEDYKEREYTEHWAYELAELYSQAENTDACVEACDDLILWFSEGPYVLKAMELKRKYVPLSPSQHEKYKREMEAQTVKTTVPSFIKIPAESTDTVKETDVKEAEDVSVTSTEDVIEKMDAAASTTVQSDSSLRFSFGKVSAGTVKSAMDPVRMQSQLADSIRNVFAGIHNKGTVPLDTKAAEMEEQYDNLYQVEEDMSGYEIKDLEPEAAPQEQVLTEDVVLSELEKDTDETEEDQIEGQMSLEDYAKKESEFDFEALFAETTSALAKELASGTFEKETIVNTEEEADKVVAEEIERIAAEEAARMEAEKEAERIAAEEAARIEAEKEAERIAAEEAARIEAEKEAERIAAEEAARIEAEKEAERIAAEEAARMEAEEEAEVLGFTREFDFKEELKKAIVIDTIEVEDNEAESFKNRDLVDELEAIFVAENEAQEDKKDAIGLPEDFDVTLSLDESEQEEAEEDSIKALEKEAEELKNTFVVDELSEELITDPEKVVLHDEDKSELTYVPVEPRAFTDEEKEIFTYFADIPGLREQITEALCDVHNNAGDKTSKSGNFLVIGRQGSGKTRLYESMVLAICKDLGMDAAKNAKIVARDFNEKDPAAVVAKLSGGFLAIEGAGELSDEAAEKLAQAMEFRTDSLVVVLEDEKDDLYNMLEKHPNLAEKFTSVIKIPVFTNDELVTFARIYAQDQGYKMDEMGILALYTKIGDNQKDAEPVTVGKVKAMLDEAMLHANKGHRKLSRRFSKNAVDEDNRIILFEKDFE